MTELYFSVLFEVKHDCRMCFRKLEQKLCVSLPGGNFKSHCGIHDNLFFSVLATGDDDPEGAAL